MLVFEEFPFLSISAFRWIVAIVQMNGLLSSTLSKALKN